MRTGRPGMPRFFNTPEETLLPSKTTVPFFCRRPVQISVPWRCDALRCVRRRLFLRRRHGGQWIHARCSGGTDAADNRRRRSDFDMLGLLPCGRLRPLKSRGRRGPLRDWWRRTHDRGFGLGGRRDFTRVRSFHGIPVPQQADCLLEAVCLLALLGQLFPQQLCFKLQLANAKLAGIDGREAVRVGGCCIHNCAPAIPTANKTPHSAAIAYRFQGRVSLGASAGGAGGGGATRGATTGIGVLGCGAARGPSVAAIVNSR